MLWVLTKETYFNLIPYQLMREPEKLKGSCIVGDETPYVAVGKENHQDWIFFKSKYKFEISGKLKKLCKWES